MITRDRIERLRVEVVFPERGLHGAPASVYLHISVVRFFKTFSQEDVEKLNQQLRSFGNEYFGEWGAAHCRVHIDEEYGLRSWSCAGNACGLFCDPSDLESMKREDTDWIEYSPHNLDNAEQLAFLLATACSLRDLVEALAKT
jgi:hypothetical protein